jgi:hypothetical protein
VVLAFGLVQERGLEPIKPANLATEFNCEQCCSMSIEDKDPV